MNETTGSEHLLDEVDVYGEFIESGEFIDENEDET